MTLEELTKIVESQRETLTSKKGVVIFSPNGPVGMSLVEALVAQIEEQDRRISELESRIGKLR